MTEKENLPPCFDDSIHDCTKDLNECHAAGLCDRRKEDAPLNWGVEAGKVFCVDCAFFVSETRYDLPACSNPKNTGMNCVLGVPNRKPCLAFNKNGDCKGFWKKKGWLTNLLESVFGDGTVPNNPYPPKPPKGCLGEKP